MWVGVRLTDADCADASQTDRLLLMCLPSLRVSQYSRCAHERRRHAIECTSRPRPHTRLPQTIQKTPCGQSLRTARNAEVGHRFPPYTEIN